MSAESTLANAVPNVATASFPDLAGKSVLISGGASGIGAELVRAFAGQSCDVTFVDIDMTAGQELAEALSRDGRARVTFVACDVTDGPAYRAAIDGAAAYSGRFDILVNNAVNDVRRPTVTLGDDEVDWLMAINFKHQLVAAQAAFRHMAKAGRGSIINFSSVAPTMRIPDLAVYGSAKAAVHGLTRMLAREFGRSGVRVNTIVPGYVFTPKQVALWFTPDVVASVMTQQCLTYRLSGPDIANMVLFLASDASAGCTSQAFTVDAGLT